MPVYQVMMHIPEAIHRGLQSGTMVRDAAGIVRATGGNSPGAIIAHLREVGTLTVTQAAVSPLLISTGIIVAIQIASTIYLSRKLNKIETLTREVLATTKRVLVVANEIREEQYRDKARNLLRALEFLRRWQRSQEEGDLRKAFDLFILGKADMLEVLQRIEPEAALEDPDRTRFLVNATAMNGAGQLLVMNLLGYPVEELQEESRDYCACLDAKAHEFRTMPAPRKRLPTLRMLEATKEQGGPLKMSREWSQSLDTVSRSIEAEAHIIKGLANMSPRDMLSFERRVELDKQASYCLLVNEAV